MARTARDFLLWFHQAPLPKDPLNNPLATAETKLRVAGALREPRGAVERGEGLVAPAGALGAGALGVGAGEGGGARVGAGGEGEEERSEPYARDRCPTRRRPPA